MVRWYRDICPLYVLTVKESRIVRNNDKCDLITRDKFISGLFYLLKT